MTAITKNILRRTIEGELKRLRKQLEEDEYNKILTIAWKDSDKDKVNLSLGVPHVQVHDSDSRVERFTKLFSGLKYFSTEPETELREFLSEYNEGKN